VLGLRKGDKGPEEATEVCRVIQEILCIRRFLAHCAGVDVLIFLIVRLENQAAEWRLLHLFQSREDLLVRRVFSNIQEKVDLRLEGDGLHYSLYEQRFLELLGLDLKVG
jgi:hypothetical protein